MASVTTHIAKGLQNVNSSNRMTWWKTSFNMPVPNLTASIPTWTRYSWPLSYDGEATSFDLSGFDEGWEAVIGVSVVDIISPEAQGTNITIKQEWIRPDGVVQFRFSLTYAVPTYSSWYEVFVFSNQWVAGWEFNQNGTYNLRTTVSGGISLVQDYYFTITNCPSTSGSGTIDPDNPWAWWIPSIQPRYMWVEGAQICWTGAGWHTHKVSGTDMGSVGGTAGYVWSESTNGICWIGTDGHKYKNPVYFIQFASSFSNGSPADPNPWTWSAGWTWMDSQFGDEHIATIGSDGHKYLFPSGHDPYVPAY